MSCFVTLDLLRHKFNAIGWALCGKIDTSFFVLLGFVLNRNVPILENILLTLLLILDKHDNDSKLISNVLPYLFICLSNYFLMFCIENMTFLQVYFKHVDILKINYLFHYSHPTVCTVCYA